MSKKIICDTGEHSEGIINDNTNNVYSYREDQFLLNPAQQLPQINYKTFNLGVRGEIKRTDIYEV